MTDDDATEGARDGEVDGAVQRVKVNANWDAWSPMWLQWIVMLTEASVRLKRLRPTLLLTRSKVMLPLRVSAWKRAKSRCRRLEAFDTKVTSATTLPLLVLIYRFFRSASVSPGPREDSNGAGMTICGSITQLFFTAPLSRTVET